MTFYAVGNRTKSPRHERLWQIYEWAYTIIDLIAGINFFTGSVLLVIGSKTQYEASFFFLVGSFLFGSKPIITLSREFRYACMNDSNNDQHEPGEDNIDQEANKCSQDGTAKDNRYSMNGNHRCHCRHQCHCDNQCHDDDQRHCPNLQAVQVDQV
eukprot:m.63462 g.63462  ORF g.63462 m.63462 type:complete len:155 (-) comp13448_c0_seq2:143-607(-)